MDGHHGPLVLYGVQYILVVVLYYAIQQYSVLLGVYYRLRISVWYDGGAHKHI